MDGTEVGCPEGPMEAKSDSWDVLSDSRETTDLCYCYYTQPVGA